MSLVACPQRLLAGRFSLSSIGIHSDELLRCNSSWDLGWFEAGQERPQQLVEYALLGRAERGEELLFVAEVDLEEGVDRGLAAACQPYEDASAVVGSGRRSIRPASARQSSRLV